MPRNSCAIIKPVPGSEPVLPPRDGAPGIQVDPYAMAGIRTFCHLEVVVGPSTRQGFGLDGERARRQGETVRDDARLKGPVALEDGAIGVAPRGNGRGRDGLDVGELRPRRARGVHCAYVQLACECVCNTHKKLL